MWVRHSDLQSDGSFSEMAEIAMEKKKKITFVFKDVVFINKVKGKPAERKTLYSNSVFYKGFMSRIR